MEDRSIRVVVVDDHGLMREGLILLLKKGPSLDVVAEGATGASAIELVSKFQPDVLLLDLMLPDAGGIEVLRLLAGRARILVLSMRDDPGLVAEAFRYGATGYLLKEDSSSELLDAVGAVIAGERYLSKRLSSQGGNHTFGVIQSRNGARLTPREQAVLPWAANGATSAEISKHLSISPRTVEMHRGRIMRKLGLGSQSDLVRYAIRNKIIGA